MGKAKNYFVEEVEQNELMSKNYKKIFTTLNYIEHFIILASAVAGCSSISAPLLSIPMGITYICHDEFVLLNNVLEEYDDMTKEIKNLKT